MPNIVRSYTNKVTVMFSADYREPAWDIVSDLVLVLDQEGLGSYSQSELMNTDYATSQAVTSHNTNQTWIIGDEFHEDLEAFVADQPNVVDVKMMVDSPVEGTPDWELTFTIINPTTEN
jgi:hypothetical protein